MVKYNYAIKYKCYKCNKEYKINSFIYICPECNSNLDIIYDYQKIRSSIKKIDFSKRKDSSLFRYKELYPVSFNIQKYNKLHIGGTPLYKAESFGNFLGYNNFYLKDDTHNPSASFKDRASIITIIHALENGFDIITGASTGNAASSLSCLSSAMNVKNIIFIPNNTPKAKVAQLIMYGANVIVVNGNYDDAYDISVNVSKEFNLYIRNTGYNPFTREGKKSVSFEIAEQLNWKVPDYVFVPVGDGNILSGVWKGFKDMYFTGFIKNLPGLIGVQSEKSKAVADAFINKREIRSRKAATIADSISVDFPRDGDFALRALKESNGWVEVVSDNEILKAQKLLAEKRGIFAEPAGAASLAGLIKSLRNKRCDKKKISVLLITGNGLKDIDSVLNNHNMKLPVVDDWKKASSIIKKILKNR